MKKYKLCEYLLARDDFLRFSRDIVDKYKVVYEKFHFAETNYLRFT